MTSNPIDKRYDRFIHRFRDNIGRNAKKRKMKVKYHAQSESANDEQFRNRWIGEPVEIVVLNEFGATGYPQKTFAEILDMFDMIDYDAACLIVCQTCDENKEMILDMLKANKDAFIIYDESDTFEDAYLPKNAFSYSNLYHFTGPREILSEHLIELAEYAQVISAETSMLTDSSLISYNDNLRPTYGIIHVNTRPIDERVRSLYQVISLGKINIPTREAFNLKKKDDEGLDEVRHYGLSILTPLASAIDLSGERKEYVEHIEKAHEDMKAVSRIWRAAMRGFPMTLEFSDFDDEDTIDMNTFAEIARVFGIDSMLEAYFDKQVPIDDIVLGMENKDELFNLFGF